MLWTNLISYFFQCICLAIISPYNIYISMMHWMFFQLLMHRQILRYSIITKLSLLLLSVADVIAVKERICTEIKLFNQICWVYVIYAWLSYWIVLRAKKKTEQNCRSVKQSVISRKDQCLLVPFQYTLIGKGCQCEACGGRSIGV